MAAAKSTLGRLGQVASHLSASSANSSASTSAALLPGVRNASSDASKKAVDPNSRAERYRYFLGFQTRWADNDVYSHVNNTKQLEYVDSIVNEYLINHGGLDPQSTDSPIGLVVASNFTYAAPLTYPAPLVAGLAVAKLGRSSVTYQVALFAADDATASSPGRGCFVDETDGGDGAVWRARLRLKTGLAATQGTFVHVFVDPVSRRSREVPERVRLALERLL